MVDEDSACIVMVSDVQSGLEIHATSLGEVVAKQLSYGTASRIFDTAKGNGGTNVAHTATTYTGKQTDRQTYRQTDRQIERQRDRETDRQTDKQTDIQSIRQTDNQTDRQTDRQADRRIDMTIGQQAARQSGRQADRQTVTQTQRAPMAFCIPIAEQSP